MFKMVAPRNTLFAYVTPFFFLGYTGLLCEVDIDECMQSIASCGLGRCLNMRGSYKCDCPEGYCGLGCDVDDPCYPANPCKHGSCIAVCTDAEDYKCDCKEHWSGKNCSQEIVSNNMLF